MFKFVVLWVVPLCNVTFRGNRLPSSFMVEGVYFYVLIHMCLLLYLSISVSSGVYKHTPFLMCLSLSVSSDVFNNTLFLCV
jgi:hypothetical protein